MHAVDDDVGGEVNREVGDCVGGDVCGEVDCDVGGEVGGAVGRDKEAVWTARFAARCAVRYPPRCAARCARCAAMKQWHIQIVISWVFVVCVCFACTGKRKRMDSGDSNASQNSDNAEDDSGNDGMMPNTAPELEKDEVTPGSTLHPCPGTLHSFPTLRSFPPSLLPSFPRSLIHGMMPNNALELAKDEVTLGSALPPCHAALSPYRCLIPPCCRMVCYTIQAMLANRMLLRWS